MAPYLPHIKGLEEQGLDLSKMGWGDKTILDGLVDLVMKSSGNRDSRRDKLVQVNAYLVEHGCRELPEDRYPMVA